MEADFLGGLSGATMAFGKSHRDPYATSVGHLIGKEAQGVTSRLAWGTAGALPVPLHSRLGVVGWGASWTKSEEMLPSPAAFPRHLRATCGHFSPFWVWLTQTRTSPKENAKFKMLGEWSQAGDLQHSTAWSY